MKEYVSCMELLCRGVVCICTLGLSCLTVGVLARLSVCRLNFCRVGFKVRSSRCQCECAIGFPITNGVYVVFFVGMYGRARGCTGCPTGVIV